jgi:hypothetical protein
MIGSMCWIAGLVPATHARFLCPPSQANKPIMALRRSPPLDTSMAQRRLATGPTRAGLDVAAVCTMRQSQQMMASSRGTSTNNQPPAPIKDLPAPTISLSDAPKIALPKNLAQTLQFLSDDDLETLRVSVDSELKRRRPTSARPNARNASAAQPAAAATASRGRHGDLASGTAIPAGRVSLIKASYHAGMKPVAIARTLRLSLSIVNKVLSTESKARR